MYQLANDNFLVDLLIDPATRERFLFDHESNTLVGSESGKRISFFESVARFIIEENQNIQKSGIHLEYDSDFNYTDHYQKDAVLFDYSGKEWPAMIKYEIRRLQESILNEVSENMSVILDVGCGNGWVSKKLIPLGKKVISMDISSDNPLRAVREVTHKNHAGLIADAFNIPLRENSVDCIIASEILEHVPDPKTFINGLIKLLKDKGKLIITAPYNEKIEYNLCVHCNRLTPRFAHLHSFNENNIGQFIPEKGIKWRLKSFINRNLLQISPLIFLKFLPFYYWKHIDNLFNSVFQKPIRLQLVISKSD
jgi:2-polyprenyl-3-methyl-5-hydroxy-6-metoxy-1,4-benzoquinol methylase